MHPLNKQLILQSEEAFHGPAWHGPSAWPTLKKLHWREALTRAPFEPFTAWGAALHMAYWKQRAIGLLAKASAGAVVAPGRLFRGPADWPNLPSEPDGPAWLEDLVQIEQVHERWIAALEGFPEDRWGLPVRSDGTTTASVAFGVAAHDLYHTAQIRNMGVKRF